jgi:hypothetical protein
MANLYPLPRQHYHASDGTLAAGYLLCFYEPGTANAKTTWKDFLQVATNTNPVTLDARGEADAWLSGVYDVVFKTPAGATVWSVANYQGGSLTTNVSNQEGWVNNGSFEMDSDGDGIPDNWDIVKYTPSGAFSLDSSTQGDGVSSAKFTSVGIGGGYAQTPAYLPVSELETYFLSFKYKSSVVNVRNVVEIYWYTSILGSLATSIIIDESLVNPTTWTIKQVNITPPATARYAKVRLTGCHSSGGISGSTWFDDVVFRKSRVELGASNRVVVDGDWLTLSQDVSKMRQGSASAVTTVVLTGIITNGYPEITGLSSTAGLSVGMLATGTGIGNPPNRIVSIDSSTQVSLAGGATSNGSTLITFMASLYSLVGDTVMLYKSHNCPINSFGCFDVRDETEKGQLWVLTESGIINTYAIASGTAGTIILAADFTLTSAIDLNTPVPVDILNNKFINPGMAIDQLHEGAAQTITAGAALAYTVDQWYAYCTAANVTGQRVAGAGQTRKRYQFTGAASVTGIGFAQRMEAVNTYDMNGQTCTLSVDLSNTLLTTVNWAVYYANSTDAFGTVATPTRTLIANGSFTVTNVVTRYKNKIAIPSAATTGIEVVFTVGAQISGTWTIANADLRVGAAPVPFGERPYQLELALCQRYFWKSFPYGTAPAQNAGGNGALSFIAGKAGANIEHSPSWLFPVPMRVVPTMTYYNPSAANANVRDQTASADCSAAVTDVVSESEIQIYALTGNASTVVGNLLLIHATAAARL